MKMLVFAVAMTAVAGQSSGIDPSGVWTAQFEGRTFVRLELKSVKGTIAGAISLGDVEFDTQGAVKRATESPTQLTPLLDVTRRGSIVTFARRESRDTDRFELRVLQGGRAELHMLLSEADRKELAAEGIPVPKPFVLTKR
jgi:hypothetical protein